MTIKAVLFDHDGTIVDSEAIHFRLWDELLTSYGIPFPLSDFETRFVGLPSAQIAAHIVSDYKSPVDAETLFRKKSAMIQDYLVDNAFPLIDDALAVFQSLKAAGFTLGVVTGAPRLNIDSTIAAYDLATYFDTVVCGDDVLNNKPAADPYVLATKRLGLTPEQCIAIEDSETGLQAAVSAGMRCLTVETALTPHHDLQKSECHCKNLTEANAWILAHS